MGSPARSRVAFTSRHLLGLDTGHGTFALRDGQIGARLGLLATRGELLVRKSR